MSHPDRVGDVDLAAVRETCRDDVLRDVARRVGGRAVDLGRILPGEGAPTVPCGAAVGVDDDLAPRQSRVAHRSAEDELARRVDIDEVALVQPLLAVEVGRQDRTEHTLDQVGLDQRLGVATLRVLGRDENALDLDRLLAAVLVDLVANGHLRLPVGP